MARRVGRPPKVVEALKERILNDWVQGRDKGFRLPAEDKLAAQYGANHKTIRGALAELEWLRAVVRRPFGGVFVTDYQREVWSRHAGKFIGLNFCNPSGWSLDPFCQHVVRGFIIALNVTHINLAFSTRVWRWSWSAPFPADYFAAPEVLGVVMIGRPERPILESLLTLQKPLLAVDFEASFCGIDSFVFDNHRAGALLARRLYKLGHRRTAAIFESQDKPLEKKDEAWSERRRGFMETWSGLHVPAPLVLEATDRGKYEPLLPQLREMLKKQPEERPTALLISEDFLPRVKDFAAESGIRIPDNLTVVGFGDAPQHPRSPSPLTGVLFDGYELGLAAMQHLLRKIQDPKWRTRRVVVSRLKGCYRAGETHACAHQNPLC